MVHDIIIIELKFNTFIILIDLTTTIQQNGVIQLLKCLL